MYSRQGNLFGNRYFSDEQLRVLFPVIEPGVSDSGAFDNVFELLTHSGFSVAEAVSIMIPEPWDKMLEMVPGYA